MKTLNNFNKQKKQGLRDNVSAGNLMGLRVEEKAQLRRDAQQYIFDEKKNQSKKYLNNNKQQGFKIFQKKNSSQKQELQTSQLQSQSQSQANLLSGNTRQITPMTRTPYSNATPQNRSPMNFTMRERNNNNSKDQRIVSKENIHSNLQQYLGQTERIVKQQQQKLHEQQQEDGSQKIQIRDEKLKSSSQVNLHSQSQSRYFNDTIQNPINTQKVRPRNIHSEWNEAVKLNYWEEKNKRAITPHRKYVPDQVQISVSNDNTAAPSRVISLTPSVSMQNLQNPKIKVGKVDLQQYQRERDFSSQITTIPGPNHLNRRQNDERNLTPDPKPISVLRLHLYDSFYFKPDSTKSSTNKENISNNYKSYEKSINDGFKSKKFSPMHEFIYRTPLNFLSETPSK